MAHMCAKLATWTDGRKVRSNYGLGEDQADAELTTQGGTAAKATLYADGSGMLMLTRAGKTFKVLWSDDRPEDPAAIDIFADFDGIRGALEPIAESVSMENSNHARD